MNINLESRKAFYDFVNKILKYIELIRLIKGKVKLREGSQMLGYSQNIYYHNKISLRLPKIKYVGN